MIYNMKQPSDNMLLSNSEIAAMYRESDTKAYNEEQDRILAEQMAADRERRAYFEQLENYTDHSYDLDAANKLAKVKESFIAECIYKIFKESVAFPMTANDTIVAKNLVNNFVHENGAQRLIDSFATKNLMLSEFSRICSKYYDKVLEGCDSKKCKDEFGAKLIDNETVNDFYKEIEEVDVTDASKLIKERVADAVSEFIDTNSANKIEFEDIINQAKEKAAVTKDEAVAESYISMAQRDILEARTNAKSNVFGYMVEALTTKTLTDSGLGARYIHEGSVDMNGIVDSTQLIYTMLEMVNTTNMINVDENFVSDYLINLTK